MIGISGSEKDDARITVDLSPRKDIDITIVSKMKHLFEDQVRTLIVDTLNSLNISGAKVIYEDFGGLDFVIRARLKSAVRKAKEKEALHG